MGDLTYVDKGPFRPLHLSRLNFRVENIRNIRSPDRVYPSDLHLDGIVFDSGTVLLEGHANFLAKPYAGVKAQITLKHIALDYFNPIASRHDIVLHNGILSGTGNIEYAPSIRVVQLQRLTIQ